MPKRVKPQARLKAGLKNKRRRKPPMEAEAPVPDGETMRAELTRRMVAMANRDLWRICANGACRRQRRCLPAGIVCAAAPPPRRLTPEEQARVSADIQAALRREMARREKNRAFARARDVLGQRKHPFARELP